jgi:hypothetical protein
VFVLTYLPNLSSSSPTLSLVFTSHTHHSHIFTLFTTGTQIFIDIDNSLIEIELYYEAIFKTSYSPVNAIDILSHDDLSKIKHLMALPVNLQGLPSLSLLENLKMATTTSFVSITNEGPTIHIHLQFKLFNKEPFQIVGSHDDRLALSTDLSTNFIIVSSKNDIIYTKHNQIFLR